MIEGTDGRKFNKEISANTRFKREMKTTLIKMISSNTLKKKIRMEIMITKKK